MAAPTRSRRPPRRVASTAREEQIMSKRARKRRARKGNTANHGHRPNA